MTTKEPVGYVHVDLEMDGNMNVDVQGQISYVTLYGIAAMIHEMARQQQAIATLGAAQKQGIVPVRSIPGGLDG